MYKYVTDKKYLSLVRQTCGKIMQELCHVLKEKYDISSVPILIGSGSRKLVTQNENGACDLDYNIEIINCNDFKDCRSIKEAVRKSFNIVLKNHNLNDCSDSKSSLESGNMVFTKYENKTEFSIDVGIVVTDNKGYYYRLIHEKTGRMRLDGYYWNQAPNSHNVREKADYIKKTGNWDLLKDKYLELKNMYLRRNDYNHPSFICYIEAVNNIYDKIYKKHK